MNNHVDPDPAKHLFAADCRPGVDYQNTGAVCGGQREGHKTVFGVVDLYSDPPKVKPKKRK